jgi:hypothetical protein
MDLGVGGHGAQPVLERRLGALRHQGRRVEAKPGHDLAQHLTACNIKPARELRSNTAFEKRATQPSSMPMSASRAALSVLAGNGSGKRNAIPREAAMRAMSLTM